MCQSVDKHICAGTSQRCFCIKYMGDLAQIREWAPYLSITLAVCLTGCTIYLCFSNGMGEIKLDKAFIIFANEKYAQTFSFAI